MLSSSWEIWQGDKRGRRERLILDFTSLEINLLDDDEGSFSLALPARKYRALMDREDKVYEFWRAGQRLRLRNELTGLSRSFNSGWAQGVGSTVVVGGPDMNGLASQYNIAYPAGSAQSSKSGLAGDLVLAFGREQFGTLATDLERRVDTALLTIQADAGVGFSLAKAASRQDLLSLFRALAAASAANNKPFWWRFVPTSFNPLTVELRLFPNQLGRDFRNVAGAGTNPWLLSTKNGTLRRAEWSIDYHQQVNVMYGGGAGEEASRLIALAIDDTRITGPLGRHEGFVENTQITDDNELLDFTEGRLHESRPPSQFVADLSEASGMRYGGWGLGDLFPAAEFGQDYAVRVRGVSIRVDRGAGERVLARLEFFKPEAPTLRSGTVAAL